MNEETYDNDKKVLTNIGVITSLFISLAFIISVIYISGILWACNLNLNDTPITLLNITASAIKLAPYLIGQILPLVVILLFLERYSVNKRQNKVYKPNVDHAAITKKLNSLERKLKFFNSVILVFFSASIIAAIYYGLNSGTLLFLLWSWPFFCIYLAQKIFWHEPLVIKFGSVFLNLVFILLISSGTFYITGYEEGFSRFLKDKIKVSILNNQQAQIFSLIYFFNNGILVKNNQKKLEYITLDKIQKLIYI